MAEITDVVVGDHVVVLDVTTDNDLFFVCLQPVDARALAADLLTAARRAEDGQGPHA
jgi:hypothetical protein